MTMKKNNWEIEFDKKMHEIVNIGARKAVYLVTEAKHPEWTNETIVAHSKGLMEEYEYEKRYILELKDFIRSLLTQQKQELLAEVRGIVGEDEPRVEIEPRETFTQRMAKATYQNALRSELRTKLEELEKKV